jgi:hypothetical protein
MPALLEPVAFRADSGHSWMMPEDNSSQHEKEPDGGPPASEPVRTVKEPRGQSNPLYGCAILVIAILTFGGTAFYMFVYTPYMQNKEIAGFAVQDAPPLEPVKVDETQKSAMRTKLETFSTMANLGKPVTLTFSADELNTIVELAAESGVADYRGMVRFTGMDATAELLKADIRWKMNSLPFVQGPERYLAGHATFKPVIENNALELHIETIDVPGKTVSPGFIRQLHTWPWLNLAKLKNEVRTPLSKVTRFEFSAAGPLFILHCGENAPP